MTTAKHKYEPRLQNLIGQLSAKIDKIINSQTNAILHHPNLQRLEGSWRGLWKVICEAGSNKEVIVRLLNISARELNKDISGAVEFDQSFLFKQIYTSEFDQAGGQPYGLLIADFYFSHKATVEFPDSVNLLKDIAKIAASAFTPFISSVSSELFGQESYKDTHISLRLDNLFKQKEYIRWKTLRKQNDTRYLGFTLPRCLMRSPYNGNGIKNKNRLFKEITNNHEDYLWGNASYAYACTAINCFLESGWFAEIRGLPSATNTGGSVNLSRDYYATDKPGLRAKPSVEYTFTDNQEKEITEQGYITLQDNQLIEKGVFYSCQSIQKPINYNTEISSSNFRMSTMLHYILCASRFAHYIKIIVRDKVGSFISANECENYLSNWLANYCSDSKSASLESKAKYPLNEAQVKVTEQAGQTGKYRCQINLKPHYQLDNIDASLALVTNITLIT